MNYCNFLVAALILACAKGTFASFHSIDQKVASFVGKAVSEDYTNWMIENDLEPTPVVSNETVDVSFSNERSTFVDATFDNIYAAELSESFWPLDIAASLEESQIKVECTTSGYMAGTYKANGTAYNETVRGNGNWTFEIVERGWFIVNLVYENFKITDQGYIDVRNGTKSTAILPGLGRFELLLSDFSAGEHESIVKDALQEKFYRPYSTSEWINNIERNPMSKYLDQFVTATLLATPISEM